MKVEGASSRRQAVAGLSLATSLSLLPSRAWALIPDEEDEELLEKAKANRQKRLAAQKEVTRWVLSQYCATVITVAVVLARSSAD